jgi:tetratricopeptide (TPR) repeat protein
VHTCVIENGGFSMNEVKSNAQHLTSVVPSSEEALAQCQIAKQLEDAGKYEEARVHLSPWWQLIGQMPVLSGLDQRASAEMLMRAGSLSGWIGSLQQVSDAHAFAQTLLLRSIALFKALNLPVKRAEALLALAICYWQVEDFDYASDLLQQALGQVGEQDEVLKAVILLNCAIIARAAREDERAFDFLACAAPLFEGVSDDALCGRFHSSFAVALKNRWKEKRDEKTLDQALLEFTAASHHLEEAGYKHQSAAARNNLADLLGEAGRYQEALENLDHAASLFRTLKDNVHLAQVEETRAKVLLIQGRNLKAERAAVISVSILERSSEKSLLIKSLITKGRALARLSRIEDALRAFLKALSIAEELGDEKAAQESIEARIEEIAAPACVGVNITCAQAVHSLEKGLFRRALVQAEGKVTHAARILGIERRAFTWMLKARHKDLLHLRTQRKQNQPKGQTTRKPQVMQVVRSKGHSTLSVLPHRQVVNIELPTDLPPDGSYFTVQMSTDALSGLGIQGGDWAVVLRGPVSLGQPVAVRELSDRALYSVGYMMNHDAQICLEADDSQFPPLHFDEDKISIEGRIIGYCRQEEIRAALSDPDAIMMLKVIQLNG